MYDNSVITDIWRKYEKGITYLQGKNLIEQTNENYNFYLGDQWHGLEADGERLPSFNFIKGIIKYKTAIVAQNSMIANYSNMDKNSIYLEVCEKLNAYFRKCWEKGKMDTNSWKIIKDAAIAGESYLFYGTADVTAPQILTNCNVLLSDEQNSNLQEQKYILIYERRFVSDVKREAKENGVSEEDISLILADNETENQVGNVDEIRTSSEVRTSDDVRVSDEKCSSILYMEKGKDGIVHIMRSTRSVIYQPDTAITPKDANGEAIGGGLTFYPIINFVWEEIKNSARGNSEVRHLVPNQLELNKTLARRALIVKFCAFPKIVYDENAIQNPESLDKVGAKIAVHGNAQAINSFISYLNPTSMSDDAQILSEELKNTTRDMAGAGDSATGQVDPTKASGAAIIAVKDQAALPLNEQVSTFKQFVEDLALLWYDIWVAYNPNGLEIDIEENGQQTTETIDADILSKMKINVRIDVSQANPYSKYAQEQALDKLLEGQKITFEEYVEALDEQSSVPKGKLQDILEKRKIQQANQAEALQAENENLKSQLQGQQQEIEGYKSQDLETQRIFNEQKYRENEIKISKEIKALEGSLEANNSDMQNVRQ